LVKLALKVKKLFFITIWLFLITSYAFYYDLLEQYFPNTGKTDCYIGLPKFSSSGCLGEKLEPKQFKIRIKYHFWSKEVTNI